MMQYKCCKIKAPVLNILFEKKIKTQNMKKDITELYSFIDDFCKIYAIYQEKKLIPLLKRRNRDCKMSLSEKLNIMLMYHTSHTKNFKYFYKTYIEYIHKDDFPDALSYNRFVELMPRLFIPLNMLMHLLLGEHVPILLMLQQLKFAYKRQSSNKVFSDKGYIKQNLFVSLYARGLKLVHGIKKNMKNKLLTIKDKMLLRKRNIIETVFGYFKNSLNIEHTRHRSHINAFVTILAALVAYSLKKTKPSVKFDFNCALNSMLIPN